MKSGTRLIEDRLSPTSLRLVRDIVGLYPESCRTSEFQDALRSQLAAYGWQSNEVEQAMSEVQEIADAQK